MVFEGLLVSVLKEEKHSLKFCKPVFCTNIPSIWGFPGGTVVKNLPANAADKRDSDLIPGLGRSLGVGKWQSTPVFLPGKFQGQRGLAGYSPWGRKESDTTEHTHKVHTSLTCGI